MGRKIFPLQSVACPASTTTYLPVTGRPHHFIGEADGKPTYDFIVSHAEWDGAAAVSYSVKYAGIKNGRSQDLWHEFPYLATIASTPVGTDDVAVSIIPGTGVSGILYYVLGAVTL